MAKGNCIIVSADPKGVFDEGIIDDTSLPGTIMEIVPGSAIAGTGRFHVRAAATGTQGKSAQQMVLLEDRGQGKGITDAYVAGTNCRLYTPLQGEECNVLVGTGPGTGTFATVTVGERLMLYSSAGILVSESGTPESTPWQALESHSGVTLPDLTWCRRI